VLIILNLTKYIILGSYEFINATDCLTFNWKKFLEKNISWDLKDWEDLMWVKALRTIFLLLLHHKRLKIRSPTDQTITLNLAVQAKNHLMSNKLYIWKHKKHFLWWFFVLHPRYLSLPTFLRDLHCIPPIMSNVIQSVNRWEKSKQMMRTFYWFSFDCELVHIQLNKFDN
jgi:hypothetical protein